MACADSTPCTTDSCKNGACVHLPNTATCSDGNACTAQESCLDGSCSGAVLVDCDDTNLCTHDFCTPTSGCGHSNLDGVSCEDGDPCTVGEVCSGAACGLGAAKNCNDGNGCTDDTCIAGACLANDNTAACDDGEICTTGDACSAGACTSGPQLPCSDGDPCTTGDVCYLGVGCAGAVFSCDDGNVCTQDYCDATTGICAHPPVGAASLCTDNDACTSGDACVDGLCQVNPFSCDDGNECTVDSCDSLVGCVYVTTTSPCSDDGNACTSDQCDGQGACNHPAVPDATPCWDFNACTVTDVCVQGNCQPGAALVCPTAQTCNTIYGCICAEQYVTVAVNGDVVCAPDYPIWGTVPLTPVGLVTTGYPAGTVKDMLTGLLWQKASNGTAVAWETAQSYCDALVLGGYTDWRLPTEAEFESILDFNRTPAISTKFTTVAGSQFWTATPSGSGSWWLVTVSGVNDMGDGAVALARCTR
jgi:hypothetical protein